MNKIKYSTHNWGIKRALNRYLGKNFSMLNGKVIDLGCGERPFENDILAYADSYIGVDWSNTIHNLKADIIADLNQSLPIESNSYDAVTSFEVLEHLCEPQTMLQESYRILKKDGVLLLSIPFQWWVHEAPWDYQRFTRYGLEYQLKKVGYIDIEIQETTGFWLLWVLKLNYQLQRLTRFRTVGKLFRVILFPFWFILQWLAIFLDKFWIEPNETAGYVVTARKPN